VAESTVVVQGLGALGAIFSVGMLVVIFLLISVLAELKRRG